jgi:hypothetical protein
MIRIDGKKDRENKGILKSNVWNLKRFKLHFLRKLIFLIVRDIQARLA